MKMEQTECSETSAYKIQTPGNYQKENIHHTEHGESLKPRYTLLLSDSLNGILFSVRVLLCKNEGLDTLHTIK